MRKLYGKARLAFFLVCLLVCVGLLGCGSPDTILLGMEGPIGGQIELVVSGGVSRIEGLEGSFSDGELVRYTVSSHSVRIEGEIRSLVVVPASGGAAVKVRSVDVSRAPGLVTLECAEQRLETLDLSRSSGLASLSLSGNPLRSLDLGNCPLLARVHLDRTSVSSLNVSYSPHLTELSLDGSQVEVLDLRGCSQLSKLQCASNRLRSLDLSDLHGLRILSCSNNELDTLDVSGNRLLEVLDCARNGLSGLDLSANSRLRELWCQENRIGIELMERLVGSLPVASDRQGRLVLLREGSDREGNETSPVVEAIVRLRGWEVYEMVSREE